QLAAAVGHVHPGRGQPLVQPGGAVAVVGAEDDQGRAPGPVPGADQPVAARVEALEEPLDQGLVPGGDPVDPQVQEVADRGRPGPEGEEVGRAGDVGAGRCDV